MELQTRFDPPLFFPHNEPSSPGWQEGHSPWTTETITRPAPAPGPRLMYIHHPQQFLSPGVARLGGLRGGVSLSSYLKEKTLLQ